MADNYLITGYWGEPHVTVENDRGFNAAVFGTGKFVLPVGEMFRAEYIGNNTVRIYDGKLIDNGAVAGIPAGEYIELMIPEAGQGMKRNDLIIFEYSRNDSTLVESGMFKVLSGAETIETAVDPVLTENDLLSNIASFDQMALWRIPVAGSVISAPVKVFKVAKNMESAGGAHVVSANSTDGTNYEATVENVDELYTGLEIIIIPNMTSKTTAVMLNVNGLGAKRIRMPISSSTSATTTPTYDDFYAAGKPVKLLYDASSLSGIWRIVDKNRANAVDLYGTTPIEKGGTGADNAEEACENLGAIQSAQIGVANGVASLDNNGELLHTQVPLKQYSVIGRSLITGDALNSFTVQLYRCGRLLFLNGSFTFTSRNSSLEGTSLIRLSGIKSDITNTIMCMAGTSTDGAEISYACMSRQNEDEINLYMVFKNTTAKTADINISAVLVGGVSNS